LSSDEESNIVTDNLIVNWVGNYDRKKG
jgi:hypothetical protein